MPIQLKRGYTSELDPNLVLLQGQPGVEMSATTNSAAEPFKLKIGDGVSKWSQLPYIGGIDSSELAEYVKKTTTINGKPLSGNITLTASDVGAQPAGSSGGGVVSGDYVPLTRKINNKPLTSDITLSASDVDALPSSWRPSASDLEGFVPTSTTVNNKPLTSNIVLSASDVGALPATWKPSASDMADFVPSSRTINNKPLTANITLSASDVGALPSTWRPSDSDLSGFVPTSRKINNKALTSDISLTASDVGAAATSHTHSNYLSSSGTAASATKLATARTIQTNLGSTSSASFNGTANITPGITGTLSISHGGTGSTTAASARLAIGALGNNNDIGTDIYLEGNSAIRSTGGTYPSRVNFTDIRNAAVFMQRNVDSNLGCSYIQASTVGCRDSVLRYVGFSGVYGENHSVTGSSSGWLLNVGCFGSGHAIAQNNNFFAGEQNTADATNQYGGIAIGRHLSCTNPMAVILGTSNVTTGSTNAYGTVLIVGGGDWTPGTRRNILRCSTSGVYGYGSYNSSGADYAEYFEWADGNLSNEDRVGRFVTLDGDKIRLADESDEYVLGVVSACPSVVGDAAEDMWAHETRTDVFGRFIYEDRVVEATDDQPGQTYKIPGRNPDYIEDQEYIPRSQRPEWDAIGLLGKLVVIDDGTCQVNEFCNPSAGGVATASGQRTHFRVMKRLDYTHIQIMILPY